MHLCKCISYRPRQRESVRPARSYHVVRTGSDAARTVYIKHILLLLREQRFDARAHMLQVTVPIFLKYENASKNSEKIGREHIQVLNSRVNFRQKISIFAPCVKRQICLFE